MKAHRFILGLCYFAIFLGAITVLLLATRLLSFQMPKKSVQQAFHHTEYVPEQHFLQLDEGKLHYITAGDPSLPPLLMIHGSPGAWTDFVPLISQTDILEKFFVIAIDRPGYGQTEIASSHSLQKQAGFLQPLIDKYFGQQPGIILGHSYGGALTVEAAKRYNSNLQGIVVAAGTVANPYQDRRWYNYVVRYTPAKWLITEQLLASNREMWKLEEDLEQMEKNLHRFDGRAAILQGDQDWLVNKRSSDYLHDLLNKAEVKVMQEEGLDHFIIWTDRELIVEALEWVRIRISRRRSDSV